MDGEQLHTYSTVQVLSLVQEDVVKGTDDNVDKWKRITSILSPIV